MPPDPEEIALLLTHETGLAFRDAASTKTYPKGLSEGDDQVELVPHGILPSHSFTLTAKFGWRHLEVKFVPGNFAGDLVREMSTADNSAKHLFVKGIQRCMDNGATVRLLINEAPFRFDDPSIWETPWKNFEMGIRVGQLHVESKNAAQELVLLVFWMTQLIIPILSLLPTEQLSEDQNELGVEGYPEGALTRIWANKYERDARNRAAALAIHGCSCVVCEQDLSELYGPVGLGVVEVHHTTPVSLIGKGYRLNPETDLVPLCPNCHAIAHRKTPPFSIQELKVFCRQNISQDS